MIQGEKVHKWHWEQKCATEGGEHGEIRGFTSDPEQFYLEAQENKWSQKTKPTECGQIRGNQENVLLKEFESGKYDQKEHVFNWVDDILEAEHKSRIVSFGCHNMEVAGDHCGTGFVEEK